jgi:hypothetical protein
MTNDGISDEWLRENEDKIKILCEDGETRLEPVLKYIGKMNESYAKNLHEWRDARIKSIQDEFEKATTYTNFIVIAGYAGFFTLWKMVQGDLPNLLHLLSGIFIGLSIIPFVFSEVYGVGRRMVKFRKHTENSGGDINTELKRFDEIEREFSNCLNEMWGWHFYPAGVFGLLGAILLMTFLLYSLCIQAGMVV